MKNLTHRHINLDFQQEFSHLQLPKYESLPFGAIIGKVNLIDTIKTDIVLGSSITGVTSYAIEGDKSWQFTDQEKQFGDYTFGRYGWLLSDPILFKIPIPAKGQLGLWNFDESLLL